MRFALAFWIDAELYNRSPAIRAYRVIYEEREGGEVILIAVLEVDKHDY